MEETKEEASILSNCYNKEIIPLLELVNDLRDLALDRLKGAKDIKLPRIAVVGQQSTGKSSVLESICGIDLPRGAGTVTKNPIEIRMQRSDTWSCTVKAGKDGEPNSVESMNEIKGAIDYACQEVIGGNHFSDTEVIVELFAQDAPNLTLIDLPGIVFQLSHESLKIPQNTAELLCGKIKEMVTNYIKDESTIILVVLQATDDPENSFAYRLVTELGADKRCIGVLTSIDIAQEDKQRNAAALLNGIKMKLEYGYYAVRNRSTTDIANGMTIREAREEEENFFSYEVDQAVRQVSDRLGSQRLASRLTEILAKEVKKELPHIKQELHRIIAEASGSLSACPRVPEERRRNLISEIALNIEDYLKDYTRLLRSRSSVNQCFWLSTKNASEEQGDWCKWFKSQTRLFDLQAKWCMSWFGVFVQTNLCEGERQTFIAFQKQLEQNSQSAIVEQIFNVDLDHALSYKSAFKRFIKHRSEAKHDDEVLNSREERGIFVSSRVQILQDARNAMVDEIDSTGEIQISGFPDLNLFKHYFEKVLKCFGDIALKFILDMKNKFSAVMIKFLESRRICDQFPRFQIELETLIIDIIEENWSNLTDFLKENVTVLSRNSIAMNSEYEDLRAKINDSGIDAIIGGTSFNYEETSFSDEEINMNQIIRSHINNVRAEIYNDAVQILTALICFSHVKCKNLITIVVERAQNTIQTICEQIPNKVSKLSEDGSISLDELFMQESDIEDIRKVEEERIRRSEDGIKRIAEFESTKF